MISAKPAPRYSARGTRSRQLRWLIPPTAVDEIDPCLVAGPDYELVDVDVARPGRDEGDALRDVLSAERDDALVDRLRTGLVAPEADEGEVGLHHAGVDLGHPHGAAEELHSEDVGEGPLGRLGGVVAPAAGVGLKGGDGAHVDDEAVPRGDELAKEPPRHPEGSEDVRLPHLPPLLLV